MTDFVTITLNCVNQEQLDILQAAVRLAGLNFEILFQKGILSEDYVAAYGDFFKEIGNALTNAQDFFDKPSSNGSKIAQYLIDCDLLSVGGKLDYSQDFKGGEEQCT